MNLIQRQFYALYADDMPASVDIDGVTWERVKTFKYDFFAATGLYGRGDDRIVVKIYRFRRFFGLTMAWTGRLMQRHEQRMYKKFAGVEGIPAFVGTVGDTGFAHAYVEGKELERSDRVDELFFDRLQALLEHIHNAGAAYVDLDKSHNILLGDDGRPYLIDFQISYAPRTRLPGIKQLSRYILRQMQTEEWYHFSKHKRRLRPDQLSPHDYARTFERSLPIRLHRLISRPYFAIRHLVMDLLDLTPAE